jgi:late competence protein required for DNA uptake (superfamily II DNA/RNA helicase)
MKIYLLHRFELPKHKNLWWHGESSNYQKIVLRNAVQFLQSSKKVVPKGAQCKFSAQKSFRRECRAYSEK